MTDLDITNPIESDKQWSTFGSCQVLLVSAEPWARNVLSLISQCSEKTIEVTHAIDGAQGLYYMSQSIYSGSPYQLLVLTSPLSQLDPISCIESLRAIERGLNRPPYPCLLCTPEVNYPTILTRYPQTLHLRVPNNVQAASMVAAGILQVIYTLQAYQKSDDLAQKEHPQINLS